jgi:hypothetical protein
LAVLALRLTVVALRPAAPAALGLAMLALRLAAPVVLGLPLREVRRLVLRAARMLLLRAGTRMLALRTGTLMLALRAGMRGAFLGLRGAVVVILMFVGPGLRRGDERGGGEGEQDGTSHVDS